MNIDIIIAMSILFKENNLLFIDHKEFITKIYQDLSETKQCLTITANLFSIRKKSNKYSNSKKRRRDSDQILEEVSNKFNIFILYIVIVGNYITKYLFI